MKPVPDSLPRIMVVFLCAFASASCAETQLGVHAVKSLTKSAEAAASPGASASQTGPFRAKGVTIWDGGETLEGVWVAHPLAERAERVTITNTENGRSIDAAMFHRDSAITGPAIVISSAAARALELTPGVPTGIAIAAIGPAPEPRETLPPANAVPARPQPVTGGIETAPAAPLKTLNEPAPAEPVAPAPEVPKPAESAPAPASKPKAAPQPAAPAVQESPRLEPGGTWLQIGSFGVESNAAALVNRLQGRGQQARYVTRDIGGRMLHIVLIGPLTEEQMPAARAAAKAEGIKDAIKVKP